MLSLCRGGWGSCLHERRHTAALSSSAHVGCSALLCKHQVTMGHFRVTQQKSCSIWAAALAVDLEACRTCIVLGSSSKAVLCMSLLHLSSRSCHIAELA